MDTLKLSRLLERIKSHILQYMYGELLGYVFNQQRLASRGLMEQAFVLDMWSRLGGRPLLPSLVSYRLLPYVVPHILTWKRSDGARRDSLDRLPRTC